MTINILMPTDKITLQLHEIAGSFESLRFRPGGVYVFYDNQGECLYVGQSKTLSERLRTHLASSPFADEIASVTIYFVSDPYEREVYETYAITTFDGRYNRAKKFEQRTANPLVGEEIDEAYYEIEELLRQKTDIEEAIRDIDFRHVRKPPRKFSRRTGDLTNKYMDYLDEIANITDEERAEAYLEQRERKRMLAKVSEIDRDMQELRREISNLFRKMAV